MSGYAQILQIVIEKGKGINAANSCNDKGGDIALQKIFRKFRDMINSMKNFFGVFGYLRIVLWQASKPLTILLFILSLSSGLTLVAELLAITTLINKLIEHDLSDFWLAMGVLLPWMLLFIGAILMNNVIRSIQPYLSMQLHEKSSSILKDDIFKKALMLDLRSFETAEYYNQLETAKRAINNQLTRALESVGFLIASVVELIVIIIAISNSGYLFALLLVFASIPLIMINIHTNKEFMRVNYQQSPVKRHLNYWMGLSISRETAAELRLFGLGSYFLNKWKGLSDQLIDELYLVRKKVASLRIKGEFLLVLIMAIMIWGIVSAGMKGTITIGSLVALLYMLNRFELAIGQISSRSDLLSNFFFSFQYAPMFLQSGIEEREVGLKAPRVLKQGIVFENVCFSYPGSSKLSLENINLSIAPGERIAVVGENGAGKSTLALLLLGLYQPTEGRILVDGIDLKEINPVSWRSKAAAVFQDFVRYQLSAKENIGIGNITNQDHLPNIKKAAVLSGIDDVISQLPNGYHAILGKEYQDANDLSGGEWQKVAIARAYFKEAQVLVLDEPTAALDAQSEYEVYKQFSQVSAGKTSLLISHRLGSARLADKIIYLEQGQLIEIGSHDELMLKNGPYSVMYHLQAESYQ